MKWYLWIITLAFWFFGLILCINANIGVFLGLTAILIVLLCIEDGVKK